MIGTVKWFDANKGYGFITSPAHREDLFVHWQGIAVLPPSPGGEGRGEGGHSKPFRTLTAGDQVTFIVQLDRERNRQCAVDVTVTRPAPTHPERRQRHSEQTRNERELAAEKRRYPQHA